MTLSKGKLLAIFMVLALVIAAFFLWLGQEGTEPDVPQPATNATSAQNEESEAGEQYATYSEAELANEYDRHIIFFHAGWCPDCQAFKRNLTQAGAIPEDVQILEVDYDTATELKQKYGVTIQSTFVEVDSQGNQLAKWLGYLMSEDNAFADIEAGLSES